MYDKKSGNKCTLEAERLNYNILVREYYVGIKNKNSSYQYGQISKKHWVKEKKLQNMKNRNQFLSSLKTWKIIHYTCHNNINRHGVINFKLSISWGMGEKWECGENRKLQQICNLFSFRKYLEKYVKLVLIKPTGNIWGSVIQLSKYFCMAGSILK